MEGAGRRPQFAFDAWLVVFGEKGAFFGRMKRNTSLGGREIGATFACG